MSLNYLKIISVEFIKDLKQIKILELLYVKFRGIFSMDLRSLGCFRIGLALIILYDTLSRLPDITAHLSDGGVFPRYVFYQIIPGYTASFHLLNGSWWFQFLLSMVQIIFALALLVGYKTTLVTISSWIVLVSLHARNGFILQGADHLLKLLVFLGIFLPIGRRFSLDNFLTTSRVGKTIDTYFSIKTVVFLLQIVLIYFFASLLKSGPEWRIERTAIYYVLNIDQFTREFGRFLLNFPFLLKVTTHLVILVEFIGPLFLFSFYKTAAVRLWVIIVFITLHLGFAATLTLGFFPWISILAWLALLPTIFWEKNRIGIKTRLILDHLSDRVARGLIMASSKISAWRPINFTAPEGASISTITKKPNSILESSLSPPISLHDKFISPIYRIFKKYKLVEIFLFVYIIYALAWGYSMFGRSNYAFPQKLIKIGWNFGFNIGWSMFAPFPLKHDGWYVIPGKLKSGELVDLFKNGGAVYWEKPDDIENTYSNSHWRIFMVHLYTDKATEPLVSHYAKYLCAKWNTSRRNKSELQELEIIYMREITLENYKIQKPEKVSLGKYSCSN